MFWRMKPSLNFVIIQPKMFNVTNRSISNMYNHIFSYNSVWKTMTKSTNFKLPHRTNRRTIHTILTETICTHSVYIVCRRCRYLVIFSRRWNKNTQYGHPTVANKMHDPVLMYKQQNIYWIHPGFKFKLGKISEMNCRYGLPHHHVQRIYGKFNIILQKSLIFNVTSIKIK